MLNTQRFGVKYTKTDWRDYSHAKTFGVAPLPALPNEYLLVSTILDQGATNECTSFASNAIQESQHGIQFDTQWFFDQEAVVNGGASSSGYDMRVPMKTGCVKGFMPAGGGDPTQYKEDSYFSVDGSYDTFDNIRSAMFQSQQEKKCVNAGTMWYMEWENPQGGIIPQSYAMQMSYHDVKIAGWTTINGTPYLVVQNSWGTNYGKGGLYYFPREVVNKEFIWLFMWRTPQEAVVIRTQSTILSLMSEILHDMLDWLRSIKESLAALKKK